MYGVCKKVGRVLKEGGLLLLFAGKVFRPAGGRVSDRK